jgi:hypothetical protein
VIIYFHKEEKHAWKEGIWRNPSIKFMFALSPKRYALSNVIFGSK